ncbi:MAG: putative lipid II flippase FtsW [Candidatus Paceibacterota bacterium]|jgi:cell division protein FtsW
MKKNSADKILIIDILFLLVFGLIVISSVSVVISYNNFGYNYYYLTHQFLYGMAPGVLLMFILKDVDYKNYKKYAHLFFFAAIFLLVMVFLPGFGLETKGASRWIVVGDFSFQPSELAKLAFIIYFANWLAMKEKDLKNFEKGFLPFVLIVALVALPLILQPDIGTMMVIGAVALAMFIVAGANIRHLPLLFAGAVLAIFSLIKLAPYRVDRLMVFLHPELDPKGIGYQINQALLALGSGGFFGLGYGHSRQKFNYLPEPMGDSIFAVIGEELGLFGLMIVIALFVVYAKRGFEIARNAPDNFGKFTAFGITSWIAFQAFINIAAITSLAPLTGIPLPFISYGGSSLVVSLMGMGILLNISKHSAKHNTRRVF